MHSHWLVPAVSVPTDRTTSFSGQFDQPKPRIDLFTCGALTHSPSVDELLALPACRNGEARAGGTKLGWGHTLPDVRQLLFFQPRESSDNPRLNAFCRVAPSLRLRLLAIFLAGVLLRAADFNSRTSVLVQGRRFEFFLAIYCSPNLKTCAYSRKCFQTKVFVNK